jgi:hypothetical protein
MDARQVAEAAFKTATTKPAEPALKKPSLPNVKETVSLRIDRSSSHYGFGFGLGATNRIDGRLNAIENLREP